MVVDLGTRWIENSPDSVLSGSPWILELLETIGFVELGIPEKFDVEGIPVCFLINVTDIKRI